MRISLKRLAFFLALAMFGARPALAALSVVSTITVAGSGGGADAVEDMAQDASGNLYVAGHLSQAGGSDIWVAKYSPALVLLSTYTYDRAGFEDYAWSVSVDTATGNVFVAGFVSTAPASSSYDIWFAKFDSSLALISSATINGSAGDRDEAMGVRVDGGAVYVVGRSSVTGGPVHWVSRYDTNLVLLSSSAFAQYDPYSYDIVAVSASSLFVAGGRGPNGTTSPDAWLGKYDWNLVLLTSAALSGPGANIDEFMQLAADGSGGVYAAGFIDSAANASDRFLIHYDANLVLLSSASANGPGNSIDYLTDILVASSGTVLVSGSVSDIAGAGSKNVFIAEYTTDFVLISSTTHRSSGTGFDHAKTIVLGTNNDLYAAGWVTEANQDAWIARLSVTSAPAAPSGFAGAAQSSSSILWSWTDNSTNETGFRIMLGAGNLSGDLSPNTTYWIQAGLSANTASGTLLARAFNGGGTADSGGAARYTLANVPVGVSSAGVGVGAATLSWGAGGNPAGSSYALERSTGTGYGVRLTTTVFVFADSTLSPASTYYYRVRAFNGDGLATAYTSTLTVVTPPLPVQPAPASIAPSSGAAGASVGVTVTGTGFDATATLTLEKTSVDAGVWTATGSFATARMLGSLTKLRDGKVLLAGGMLEGAAPGLPQVDVFNPVTGAWTAGAPLPEGRNQFASVLLPDGRVLIAGGQGSSGTFVNSAAIYDPVSSTWTAAAPMSVKRSGFNLTLLPSGKVLAAGGWDGATKQAGAELYDPATDSWSAAGTMSAGRVSPSATLLGNGKVLVAGDSGATAAGLTAELYDPGGNSWTLTGSMNVKRFSHTGLLLPDGRVLAASGNDGVFVSSTADVYDVATGSWTATGPMAVGRRSYATVLVSGVPLVIAGETDSAALATNENYDAASQTWRAGPPLGGVRAYPLAVVLDDGKVLVASGRAGYTGAANLNTAEVLTMPVTSIAATGVSVPNALTVSGTVNLTGAATGYWDVVVRESGGRAGRLNGGFLVATGPASPSGFTGTTLSTSSIQWSWSDNTALETGYRVMSGAANISGDLAANTTVWVQTGLAVNASTGPLLAQAFNPWGTANSGAASRYTLAAVPGVPAASGVYQTSGTLSWSAGGNPAGTVYQLERSTGTGFGLQFSGTATTYFDGYLTPGATHFFQVRALNGDGLATSYSATATVVAVAPPPVPGIAGTPAGTALGTSSLTWTWVLAAGATNHYLLRASDNSFLGASSSGPFLMAALTPNTAYGLRAAGVNVGGTGPLSPSGTAYTLAAVPSSPLVSSITATSLVASWGLNGNPGSTTAQLERSTNAVVYSTLAAGVITSYADADLIGCTTYYYRVRNANGDGLLTAYTSFSDVTANTIASPPSGLTAAANAGGTVTLGWSLSPTEGVTGYRLYWDAGTGTVSYAAPIASLSSVTAAYTTGVLTSSASYTFALRTAHRCGVVETTGALAMSGAAVAPPALRAVIKEPDSGKRVHGNRLTILGELIYGAPSEAQQVLFQYKLASSTAWLDIDEANVNHQNPDFSFPYFVHADVNSIAPGDYDLRAVAYNLSGVPDSAPPAVRVTVVTANADIDENDVAGAVKKDQTVNNTVTSVIDTAGAGAADPSVRVSIPPGAVNAATATVSVIANPAITTAAPSGMSLVGSAIKIDLSNGQTALNGTAAITLTYPDTVRFPSLLQIYYLNEATGQWSRDFNSTVNTSSRIVSGNTPHFSTFALLLGSAFALNLDSVLVYPVPFKPNGGNADEGRPFSAGDPNSGIIFANLAMGSEIKIYTLTGRQVATLENIPITGSVRWDARNQDGRDVASGAYFAVIKATGQKTVVKKLVIIR
ncbi:MAG: hypothetical protein HY923_03040 [Elusimicrobia bacterium]|nr:hypothetical protein [Elusimicrobiota bacterium]